MQEACATLARGNSKKGKRVAHHTTEPFYALPDVSGWAMQGVFRSPERVSDPSSNTSQSGNTRMQVKEFLVISITALSRSIIWSIRPEATLPAEAFFRRSSHQAHASQHLWNGRSGTLAAKVQTALSCVKYWVHSMTFERT